MPEEKVEITEEPVRLCNHCFSELLEGSNDWDSFDYCSDCDIDNFTNERDKKLEPIYAIKETKIITKYKKESL